MLDRDTSRHVPCSTRSAQTCHMIRSKSGGDGQLEDPLAGRAVEAGVAAEQLDVEPDRVARLEPEPAERHGQLEDRVRWRPRRWSRWLDGRPAWLR